MGATIRRLGWLTAGAVLALVLLELALRLLPVSKGTYRSLAFDRWPLEYTVPRSPYYYSIGWAMRNAHSGTTNNYGHVAPFDFKPQSRPVLVLGDSYIESLMNKYADTLQAHLGRLLGAPQSVYGMGVSGASASGYVALARAARKEFAPTAAVVLVSDGDFSESMQRAVGTHHLREAAGGALELVYEPLPGVPLSTRIRDAVGDSSLYRYLQINLQFSPKNLWSSFGVAHFEKAAKPASQADAPEKLARQRRVVDWFLDKLPDSLGVAPTCVVLLFDSDRYALYDPALASVPKDDPSTRAYAIEQARRRGIAVSDLGTVFAQRYAHERLRFDHHPIDRHWNAYGHKVAADDAMRLLRQAPAGCLATSKTSP